MQNVSEEDKQKGYIKEYIKKYRNNRSNNVFKSVKLDVVTNFIKHKKDDFDYTPFVDGSYDPGDGS